MSGSIYWVHVSRAKILIDRHTINLKYFYKSIENVHNEFIDKIDNLADLGVHFLGASGVIFIFI